MQEDLKTRFEYTISKTEYEISDIEAESDYISSTQDSVRYLDKLYEFMEQE